MYLDILNNKEKECFLELAYYIAKSDNDFSDSEKELIEQFRIEMQISEENCQSLNLDFKEVLDTLSGCSQLVQRAIFVEIVAISLADGIIVAVENEIIESIRIAFNLSIDERNEVISLLSNIKSLYNRLDSFLTQS